MKKLLPLALIASIAFPVAAFSQGMKVGTVDMNRAFKEYNKTKDAETKINDAKNAAKKEYDERAESYKKSLDEINKLNQQLEAPALSVDAKTTKAKERDEKITSIKNMEREINEFRQTRERQLQEQALRMREGIVKEITEIVMDKVKANNLDLVFDKSGMSLNGVPLLMYSREAVEFTNDIIAVLNKPGRVSSTPDTAGSPAAAASRSSGRIAGQAKALTDFQISETGTHAASPRVFFLAKCGQACRAVIPKMSPRQVMVSSNSCWRTCLVSCLLLPAALSTVWAQGWESTVSPHAPGSFPQLRPVRVSYGFGWNGITAAAAEMRLSKSVDGHLQLDATGHTTGLARSLWNFDGTHVSTIDAQTLRPIQVREAEVLRSKKMETELSFTPQSVISKRNETRGPSVKSKTRYCDLPNVHSIDSALFYLRSQSLKPDAIQRIVVYPATAAYLCTVTPVGREQITVPAGSYEALKLDLQLSKIGGKRELLPHKKFRRATIWLSDDSDRLVVRIEAQIFAGTIFTELQSVQFEEPRP